jgi:hypothetical protein
MRGRSSRTQRVANRYRNKYLPSRQSDLRVPAGKRSGPRCCCRPIDVDFALTEERTHTSATYHSRVDDCCPVIHLWNGPDHRPKRQPVQVIALENAWNQAEERKDTKALDEILDDTLRYTDYDGTTKTKAEFLASVKAPARHPEQQVTESMNARVYGDAAVVTGIYRVKGMENGKRPGRFTDTWINRNGTWVCVASQDTLISKQAFSPAQGSSRPSYASDSSCQHPRCGPVAHNDP